MARRGGCVSGYLVFNQSNMLSRPTLPRSFLLPPLSSWSLGVPVPPAGLRPAGPLPHRRGGGAADVSSARSAGLTPGQRKVAAPLALEADPTCPWPHHLRRPADAHLHTTVLLHLRGRAGGRNPGVFSMRTSVDTPTSRVDTRRADPTSCRVPGCTMEADPTGSNLKSHPLRLRAARVSTRLTSLPLRRSCALFL